MLVVNNLHIGYNHPLIESSFSDEFKVGEVVILNGDNGVGKSTLLKSLSLLNAPLSGEVTYVDLPKIGWVDSYKPNGEYLTVRNYLSFGLSVQVESILKLLQKFRLEIDLDDFINELSDGQFRKLAICRQLLKEPDVLFLDEPSVYLDGTSKRILVEIIKEFSRTGLIFCSSHDKDFSNQIATRTILITKTGYKGAY